LHCRSPSPPIPATPHSAAWPFFLGCISMRRVVRAIAAAAALECCCTCIPAASRDPPAKAAVCIACHGANGNSTDPQYPILAGQSWRYIYIQLKDFKEGRRKDP